MTHGNEKLDWCNSGLCDELITLLGIIRAYSSLLFELPQLLDELFSGTKEN